MTRINVAKLAIVPRWVVLLPGVQGNPTRIATYVAIRIIEYANQGREWASERELADDIAEVSGVGAEATRKHLRALRQLGAVQGDAGEIVLPTDEPSGDHGPQSGDARPQSGDTGPHAPSLTREKESKSAASASPTVRSKDWFEKFWKAYPHKTGKPSGIRAWNAAMRRGDLEAVRAGLAHWKRHWELTHTPEDKIPYPATWLNDQRYNDMPPTGVAIEGRHRLSGTYAFRADGVRITWDDQGNEIEAPE